MYNVYRALQKYAGTLVTDALLYVLLDRINNSSDANLMIGRTR